MCGIKKRCITIHNAHKFSESFTHLSVSFASNFSFKNFLALVRKQSSLQQVNPEKLVSETYVFVSDTSDNNRNNFCVAYTTCVATYATIGFIYLFVYESRAPVIWSSIVELYGALI